MTEAHAVRATITVTVDIDPEDLGVDTGDDAHVADVLADLVDDLFCAARSYTHRVTCELARTSTTVLDHAPV
jgi:hypothetical protein